MSPACIVEGKAFRDCGYFTGGRGKAQREDGTRMRSPGELGAELWLGRRAWDAQARALSGRLPWLSSQSWRSPREAAGGLSDESGHPWLPRETICCPSYLRGVLSPPPVSCQGPNLGEKPRGGRGGPRQAMMIVLKSGQDSIEHRGFGK